MAVEPAGGEAGGATRPDYRWEKIIRAIVVHDRRTVSEAVEHLITKLRPGLPETERKIIRRTGKLMVNLDGERLNQGFYGGWKR